MRYIGGGVGHVGGGAAGVLEYQHNCTGLSVPTTEEEPDTNHCESPSNSDDDDGVDPVPDTDYDDSSDDFRDNQSGSDSEIGDTEDYDLHT